MTASKEYMKTWREKNKERLSQYSKDYAKKNRKRIQEYMRNYKRPESSLDRLHFLRKEYVKNNKEKHLKCQRNATLKKKYGITLDDFNQILEKQNNTCPICLRVFEGKIHPCVDHCHETNLVRGILCRGCNASIGQLGDKVEYIERALNYLRNHYDRRQETRSHTRMSSLGRDDPGFRCVSLLSIGECIEDFENRLPERADLLSRESKR